MNALVNMHKQSTDVGFMVFALLPHTIMEMVDLSWPGVILGSKKNNPTTWRVLTDLVSGKTAAPQRKTLEKLNTILASRFNSTVRHPDFLQLAAQVPDGPPWEVCVASFNAGIVATGGQPCHLLACEAVRLERMAAAARASVSRGDLTAAVDWIKQWDMNGYLPSLKEALPHIDISGSTDRFARTAAPVVIVSTLYLLACWEVDFFDGVPTAGIFRLLPERRGHQLIRPMRRWLEYAKSRLNLRTSRQMADILLAPRSREDDPETLNRLFRKWWQKGEIPAWSKVPHIVDSIVRVEGDSLREEINHSVRLVLMAVRFLDRLLSLSISARNLHLPEYDPLSPFRDYPLMCDHARSLKAALQSRGGP